MTIEAWGLIVVPLLLAIAGWVVTAQRAASRAHEVEALERETRARAEGAEAARAEQQRAATAKLHERLDNQKHKIDVMWEALIQRGTIRPTMTGTDGRGVRNPLLDPPGEDD